MKRVLLLAAVALAALTISGSQVVWARGGGGGGRGGGGFGGGGGGGARMGGMSGGMARPAPSRPAPAPAARPSMGASSASHGPSMSRPNVGGATGVGTGRVGAGNVGAGNAGAGRVGAGTTGRPSQRDVSDFLNLPSQPSAGADRGTSGIRSATGPGGGSVTVAGKGGTRTGPGGTTVGAGRAAVKVTGPGGNSYVKVAGGAGVKGPWGNTVAAGRGASFANGQFVGGKTWSAVNGNFNHWNAFRPGWAAGYPGAWWPGRWAVAGGVWAAAAWSTTGAYCGCGEEPAYYDYDANMTYQDGNVYYGDQALGTTEEYYNQASEQAAQGAEASNEDWLPLGVFGVVADGATEAEKLLQLAVNRDGVIRGNYQDLLTNQVTAVTGSVDQQTQRVVLRLEGNDTLLAETGLYNLTNDEAPLLIHLGPDRQESRVLVRLQQPEEGAESTDKK